MENTATPRREGQRIDLRLRVRYSVAGAHGEAEASDVSPHGLRLESDHALNVGARLTLQVDAGEGTPTEVAAQVMWCRAHPSPTGKTVHDVGLYMESAWLTPEMGKLGAALSRLFALQARESTHGYVRAVAALQDGTTLRLVDLRVGLMQFQADAPLLGTIVTGAPITLLLDAEGGPHTVTARVAWVSDQSQAPPGAARFSDAFGVDTSGSDPGHKSLLERIRVGQTQLTGITVRR